MNLLRQHQFIPFIVECSHTSSKKRTLWTWNICIRLCTYQVILSPLCEKKEFRISFYWTLNPYFWIIHRYFERKWRRQNVAQSYRGPRGLGLGWLMTGREDQYTYMYVQLSSKNRHLEQTSKTCTTLCQKFYRHFETASFSVKVSVKIIQISVKTWNTQFTLPSCALRKVHTLYMCVL